MVPINTILLYGILTAALLSGVILISLYINPRIWLQDLPKEVQKAIPQKSMLEKRQTLVVLVLFLVIYITLPAMAVINLDTQPTFTESLIITYSICFVFNLVDLLIIDWLIVCTLTPDFIKISGVEQHVYKNYRKHLKDFFKGVFIIIVPAFCSGVLGYFCSKIL